MKIGILTIHDSPNYGANLQCYGLWKYLTNQGYDCEVIDLHRPVHDDYIPSKKYKSWNPKRKNCKTRIKEFIKQLFRKKRKPKSGYSPSAKPRFASFNALMTFSQPYRSIDLLYKNPPKYDVYIAGSDQLWNPLQPYCIEPYFFTFVGNKDNRKISFSTSISIKDLRNDEKKLFKKWLSEFYAISVREKQAKELLESFIDRNVMQVADPTFLLEPEDWKSLSVKPDIERPYILYFPLNINQSILEQCKKISRDSGMDLYVLKQIQNESKAQSYHVIKDAGPREFLGYIENAELVITDSFHGTVFSLILGSKNFYTFIPQNDKNSSRIEDLLDMFGLKNHIIHENFTGNYDKMRSEKPNRHEVLSIMNSNRDVATRFLKTSIG